MAFVTVTVTVPEEHVADMLRYAAELTESESEALTGSGERKRATPHGFGREAVRKAYLGGSSEFWRPWLEHLASNPDEWLSGPEIAEGVDMDPAAVPGMLGAAERRCRQRPPYEKRWMDGHREFLMPESVAEIIRELAE